MWKSAKAQEADVVEIKRLLREPRIIIVILLIVAATIAINPKIAPTEDGTVVRTNIVRGLDLQGGVRAIVTPENASKEVVDRSIDVLTTRINAYGLKEIPMRAIQVGDEWYIEIEWAGATEEEVRDLIEKQGRFDAMINREVELVNGAGTLRFNGRDYGVQSVGDKIVLNEQTLGINDSFVLDGVELTLTNKTANSATLSALVYSGADIIKVFRDPTRARVTQTQTGWRFQFAILTTPEAAEKFAKATADVPIEAGVAGEKNYLTTNIDFYLDGKLIRSLKIAASLRGVTLTEPVIEGPGETREKAKKEMSMLQSILESGALPTAIKIESIQTISATLGEYFMQLAVFGILAAIVAVGIIVFIRYKDPRVTLPIIFTSGTEVLLIFGVAAAIHWTIDLAAIAGIMAAVGTGVDNQIVITDEGIARREELSLKQRLKQALFIIFISAFTTTGAMIPLFIAGAAFMKGFAFTTMLGIWIGVLITRPMYAKILEYIQR